VKPQGLITVCALLLLSGCSGSETPSSKDGGKASASSDGGGTKEVGVNNTVRQPDNPAEREGVKVYRPRRLANTTYDLNKRTVVDLDTGDELVITQYGHAGGPGGFSYRNNKIGPIASGRFISWSKMEVAVYAITAIWVAEDRFRNYRAREEYDVGRIGEMFRARYDQNDPHHRKEVLVVDSRPEKISEINPQNGSRRAAQ
jgi:hypothetical protein